MRKLSLTTTVAIAAAAIALVGTGVVDGRSVSRTHTSAHPTCPSNPRALGSDSVAQAALQALRDAAKFYPGANTEHPRIDMAVRAPLDRDRGRYALTKCGKTAWHRSVVVYLHFHVKSASLSQGIVMVDREGNAYKVWAVLH